MHESRLGPRDGSGGKSRIESNDTDNCEESQVGQVSGYTKESIRRSLPKLVQNLPALPEVISALVRELDNAEVSAGAIEKLIARDAALSARTLRVVNSAYYGLQSQVDNLSNAIVILGIQQIRNIVLSIAAMNLFKASGPQMRTMHLHCWKLSLGAAASSQILARKARLSVSEVDVAYIGGLLHGIGRLFLLANFPEVYLKLSSDHGFDSPELADAELDLFGLSCAEMGSELATHWKLPLTLVAAIGSSSGPCSEEEAAPSQAVFTGVQMARAFVNERELPFTDILSSVTMLGLTEEIVVAAMEQANQFLECNMSSLAAAA
ncbi:MAG: HD family phosphohydrolase [Chthonomonadaceae bacterium]